MSACKEIEVLLERYVDGELGATETSRVDSHLSVCEACAGRVRLLEREAELIRAALVPDEMPEDLCANLWASLRQPPPRFRWTPVRWAGLAAAAGILVALFVGTMLSGSGPGRELARVTTCSGPLEVQSRGGEWHPLATYAMLRDGDRIRCRGDRAGTLVVDTDNRFDLDADTTLVFSGAEKDAGPFALRMERGRLHARFDGLTGPLAIRTPVADMIVAIEVADVPAFTEIELALLDVKPEVGFLDRIHLLPAAYAGTDGPRLELLVFEGLVLLVNKSELATTVDAGQQITIGPTGPMPGPVSFDESARRAWWPDNLRPALVVRGPVESPLDEPWRGALKPTDGAGATDARPGATAKGTADTTPPTPPTPEVEGPPAPAGLVALTDLEAVLLVWKPVQYEQPIVEYGIYRRAPGDTEFGLIARFQALSKSVQRYEFRDAGLAIGTKYQYAVAAATRDEESGDLIDGKLSNVAAGSPADFHLYYTGGDGEDLAIIVVERLHGDALRRQTFMVRTRNLATGQAGAIGGPRQVVVEPIKGARHRVEIDFSTGYRLVGIVARVVDESGTAKGRSGIVVENESGIRRTIFRRGETP